MNDLLIFGASVRGTYHEKNSMDCQDAWGCASSDFNLVAVSDGAGDSDKGGLGAKISVKSAIEFLEQPLKLKDLQELAEGAVYYARDVLEKKSSEFGIEFNELACTLIVAALKGNEVAIAHVGDGAVVTELDGKLNVISEPEKSEYVNETSFITSGDWKCKSRVTEIEKFNTLAIFTDGIQRGVLIKEEEKYFPFEGFFNSLFSYGAKIDSEQEASLKLGKLLKSEKFSKLSDDDKTLVVAVLKKP